MTDTQWPRYMIFLQSNENDKYHHAGTVHAVDGETAMQNGRDIFGRRPKTVKLMAVLDAEILSRSREELESMEMETQINHDSDEEREYYVFARESHQGQCLELGKILARTHQHALRDALAKYNEKTRYLWWIFPVEKVFCSESVESDILFDPFLKHSFKEGSDYPVVTMMRNIKRKKGNNNE